MHTRSIEVGDIEELEFVQEWFGVCSVVCFCNYSDYFFVDFYEWLYIFLFVVVCPPDGDVLYEVWVYVRIV